MQIQFTPKKWRVYMHQKWLMAVATMALLLSATPMALAGKHAAPGDRTGGMSSERMGPGGMDNSNAQNQEGATRGMDRAQERMSDQGREHGKAAKKDKDKKKAKKDKKEKKEKSKNKTRDREDRQVNKQDRDTNMDREKEIDVDMEKGKVKRGKN
jgi:hypothetical protein